MKAVLFDFFGTLVEYQPDRAQLASPETHRRACSHGFVGDHDTFVTVWPGFRSWWADDDAVCGV
jgi:hypothetical protein